MTTRLMNFLTPVRRPLATDRVAPKVTTLSEAAAEAVVGGLNPQPLPPVVERE